MALRQVVLARKIAEMRAELEKAEAAFDAVKQRRAAMKIREAELEAAVNEVTEETGEEEKSALDAEIADFEAQESQLTEEETAAQQKAVDLRGAIEKTQKELDELNKAVETPPEDDQRHDNAGEARRGRNEETMTTYRYSEAGQNMRAAAERIIAHENVKAFVDSVRSAIGEKRAISNVGLTIPTEMLGIIRKEAFRSSRLLPLVDLRPVNGVARQNINGTIPEAVWTEMCATLNELTLGFNQIGVDGYMVGGYIAVCNAVLEDSDVDLASEIMSSLGTSIAKALDKAILFGKGGKMPVGIATRLAATERPAWWDEKAPEFTDLHETNIRKLDKVETTGAGFFASLIMELANARPIYSNEGLFWAMNRKTHIDLLAKALMFNSAAALVSNTDSMPILGGKIVEFEDGVLEDYEIIGGYGGNYLMAERAGMKFASSDIPLFIENQTVFKATARYDGKPVAGEAFVIVNYANATPAASANFPQDWANGGAPSVMQPYAVAIEGGTTKVGELFGEDVRIDYPGEVAGTLKKVTGFKDYAKTEAEQSGHYFAFELGERYEGKEITCTAIKTGKGGAPKVKTGKDRKWVLRIEGKDDVYVFSTKEDGLILTLTFKGATLA